ncbi:DUF6270 domain-containing protein [Knoellia subterranea]|nr:DUF6270 domain-containing protein [Knoellia subterranea]
MALPRSGDYSRYLPKVRSWRSVDAFLAAPVQDWDAGVHIMHGGADGEHFDVLIGGRLWTVRPRRCVPIFLTGAVSTRQGAQGPFFSGVKIAGEVGTPFVAISDPTLRASPDLDLGWYTGSVGAGIQQALTRLLDGLASRLGREVLLIGGSGGGFASLDQATRMSEPASALVWNAQTDLLDYSPPAVEKYLAATTATSREVVSGWSREERSARLLAGGIEHSVRREAPPGSGRRRVLYLQNETDDHLGEHALPFFAATGWQEGLRGRWRDDRGGVAVVAPMSPGHAPPPREVLTTALGALLDSRTPASAVADHVEQKGLLGLPEDAWKVRTFLVGSCVSRDTFAFLDPEVFALKGYIARQSLISAFSDGAHPLGDTSTLASRFQRRMIEGDAASSLPEDVRAAATEVDLVVWDLFDERLGVHRRGPTGFTTDSVELRSLLGGVAPAGIEHVAFGTPEHHALFVKALAPWRELLVETNLLGRTVLVAPRWAVEADDGGLTPRSFGRTATEANALTEPYLRAAVEVLGVPVLGRGGPLPLSGSEHQWGPAPFHYDDATYVRLAEELVAVARQKLGETAVDGQGVRVPNRSERAARRNAPTLRLSRSGDELRVTLLGGDPKAWSVQLFRDDERVASTGWQTDRDLYLPLAGEGRYRARAHLLDRDGGRSPVVSGVLTVS